MIVDIDAYIDGYIHYKSNVASAWIDTSNAFFEAKRQEALSKAIGTAVDGQVQAIVNKMNSQVPQAKQSIEVAKEIANGNTLEEILQEIANQMNAQLSSSFGSINSQFVSIRSKAQEYGNSKFNIDGGKFNQINNFFKLIQEGLKLLNYTATKEEIAAFAAIQDVFNGKANNLKSVAVVSQQSATVAGQIINYLATAAASFQQGKLNKQSFRSTIVNIFSTAIGERLSAQMMQSILQDIANNTNGIIVNNLQAVARSNPNIKLTGSDYYLNKSGQQRTSKVDVLGDDTFQLTVNYTDGDMNKTAVVELSSNLSVKWQQAKSKSVHIVGGTSLPGALDMMGADSQIFTAAYNVIAHRYSSNYGKGKQNIKKQSKRGDFYQAYNTLRSSVAASFFTDWLSGSGNKLQVSGGIDKAQFFMYNGKIYSVLTIVRKICENEDRLRTMAQINGVTKLNNQFEGKLGDWDWDLAKARSNKVWQAINGLTITATLNTNFLAGIL